MNKLRPATEAQVVAAFLHNEFHHHDFDHDRDHFKGLVEEPNCNDARENALRRALFYRRRGHMWNQLPPDTKWWEVRLETSDLARLEVLARTHWRKIGGSSCRLSHVVERMRTCDFSRTFVIGGTAHGGVEISRVGDVVRSVKAFSRELENRSDTSAVILIGVDDIHPVTILEGNHRFVAALLAGAETLFRSFRVFFGASANMKHCCWYGPPNARNMARYARSRLQHFGNDEADVERLLGLQFPETAPQPSSGFAGPFSAGQAVKSK